MPFRTAATAIRRALRADSIMRAARTARERPLARACMILFLFWPIANSFASVDPDLSPIQFKGLGLPNLPVDILPLIQVRLSIQNDGHGAFATLPPEQKFRLYPTNEVGAAPLGNGGSVILSDLEDLLLETPDDQSLIDRQAWLESHAAPYLSPANEASVNVVRTKLSAIRAKLTEGLGIDSQSLVSAPVLYPILNVVDTHPQEAEWILPNPLNMVVLNNLSGVRRILIPDPGVDRMLFHFGSRLQQIGYSSNDLWAVDTAAPHSGFGEVHCASNVARRRTP